MAMSIGTGVVLFVIGAILVWGLDFVLPNVNLDTIGYILMVAGAVVFIVGLVLATRRRTAVSTTHEVGAPTATRERIVERRTDADPL